MSCDELTVYPAIELQQDENDDDDDHAATWIDLTSIETAVPKIPNQATSLVCPTN